MQVGEIIQRVRTTFGDTDSVQISDTTFFQWIDDAVNDLAFELDYNQAQAKTDIVAGLVEYVLPPRTFKVYSVLYDGKPLTPMSIEEYTAYKNTSACEGVPMSYMIWDGKIYLTGSPEKNLSQGLHMFYSVLPERVTTHSDYPDIPPEYHPRITSYCLAQAYLLDNDQNMYSALIGQYKGEVTQSKDKQVNSDIGTYPQIVMTEGYEY